MKRTASCAFALASAGQANRQQWVHLMPAGTFDARDGRGPWHLASASEVVQASLAHARGIPLAVDYDHQIDNAPKNGQPAPAAGWINQLEARADGIWGLVEWTAKAAEHLARREYRFISPTFTHLADGTVSAILRAGLTNAPALTLTALASERPPMDPEKYAGELRSLLKLDNAADWTAIIAAVRELLTARASAVPSPDKFVPIEALQSVTAELNRMRKGASEEQATAIVEAACANGSLPPALKSWGIALCRENRPAFDSFVSAVGKPFAGLVGEMLPGFPPGQGRVSLSALEATIATNLGHSPEDLARTGKATK